MKIKRIFIELFVASLLAILWKRRLDVTRKLVVWIVLKITGDFVLNFIISALSYLFEICKIIFLRCVGY